MQFFFPLSPSSSALDVDLREEARFCEWEYLFFLVVRVGVPENRQDGTSSNVAGCLLAGCRSVDFGFQLQT